MIKYLLPTALALGLTACTQAQASEVAPPGEVMKLHDIAVAPSPDRIYNDIQTLVDFGTRHTLSETQSDSRGIGAARRWIFSEFEAISEECGGCLEVMYVSDFVEGETRIPNRTEVVSVIAIQRGTLDPNRFVMMSGDIDSRVTDPLNFTDDSPGANDNASGMAGTIEAARILSKYEFAGSIIYAGLAGEEQGLFGGKIVAAYALDQGWEIKGVLNNDMISNISGIDGVVDNREIRVFSEGTRATETPEEARIRRFTGGEVDSPSRNLARYITAMGEHYMPQLNINMIYRLDRFRRGGHHRPFNEVGIPGVRIMEAHEHYDRQHQDLRLEEATLDIILTPEAEAKGLKKVDLIKQIREKYFSTEIQRLPRMGENTELLVRNSFYPSQEDLDEFLVILPDGTQTQLRNVATVIYNAARPYGDVMEGVDKVYAAKATGLNAITLAGMAGAPPFPANVEASGAVQASATLTWERPSGKPAENLMGYRVWWRETTAPQWTNSRYVGNVSEWTFDNLVIDNYFFGVSAVAFDGSETPVVFPGAAGRF